MSDAFSPKQSAFFRDSTASVNVCDGSIRSGKTIITLFRWLTFVRRAPRGGELVMIGRTRDSIWRNLVAPMQDDSLFGDVSEAVVGNYGAPTVSILGRKVHLIGASDAKAEKVIRGMTIAGAYVDEITVTSEEFFTQLLGRMSVRGAKLFGSTNPDNPAHWFKVKFLDRINELPNWRHWHFLMSDNPSLSPEYIADKRREFTGLWFRRFIEGEWVAAEGAIFPMWDPDVHVIPWVELPRMDSLLAVGIDYGTNNPTAALLLGVGAILDDHGTVTERRLYLVDEWGTPKGHGKTDAQLSEGLREWLNRRHLPNQTLEPQFTICDPSAASFKTQLYADGVNNLANADNAVEYGLKTMASLLGNHQLMVSDRCRGFISEVTGYSWDEKKALKGEDAPIKVADHYMDAARYSITTTENLWHKLIRT